MPNRYVRESAIESETVDRLSWAGEVFWRRLINRVDDFGRFTANPELLRAALFPLRLNKVSAADIGKMLLECEQAGLVSTWKGEDGKAYMVMHKWEMGRAKASKYPEPPTHVNTCLVTFADAPDSDTDSDTDNDMSILRASFDEARKAYPGSRRGLEQEWQHFRKKHGKDMARIVPLLMPAIQRYRARIEAENIEPRFVKHFQGWITDSRWTEEPAKAAAPKAKAVHVEWAS